MASDLLVGLEFDPYEILGATPDAAVADLKKAYRKKALEFHPDKNPERKNWAEKKFLQLTKAYEVLSDEGARGAFDRLLKAKAAAKARTRNLDSKRRKMKEDLEARESGARSQAEEESAAMRKLEAEIERLRKQGSAMVSKEKEEVDREVAAEMRQSQRAKANAEPPRLKAKWERKDTYTRKDLLKLFEAYGVVKECILHGKGKSALVEFSTPAAAVLAIRREKGIEGDPISLSWVSGRPMDAPSSNEEGPSVPPPSSATFTPQAAQVTFTAATSRPSNFEDVVLQKLAEAQKRKNLLAQEQNNL